LKKDYSLEGRIPRITEMIKRRMMEINLIRLREELILGDEIIFKALFNFLKFTVNLSNVRYYSKKLNR